MTIVTKTIYINKKRKKRQFKCFTKKSVVLDPYNLHRIAYLPFTFGMKTDSYPGLTAETDPENYTV